MRQRRRPGLTALFDVAGADGPPRPYHLGFLIGPRINAGGRIGDAALGARLLTTGDEIEARAIAAELDRLNRARQQIEIAALAEAEAEALLVARARGARRGRGGGGRELAARRRRPSGGAAQGAVRPSGLRASRSPATTRPAPAGRSPASISAGRCAPRSRRGCWSRAAATRWRPASRSPRSGSASGAPFSRRRWPSRSRAPAPKRASPSTPR